MSASSVDAKDDYSFDGWLLSVPRRSLRNPAGELVALTTGEFELLRVLCENPQRTLTREALLEKLCGREPDRQAPLSRGIDVGITRLRQKLEADRHRPVIIQTVRYQGYYFCPEVQS